MPPSDDPVSEGPPRLPTADDFPATGPFSLAAPGPRFGGRAIDVLIVVLPALGVLIATATVVDRVVSFDPPVWLLPAMALWAITYEVTCIALFGRTIGKWIVGVRIVRYSDGRRPGVGQSFLRGAVPWAPLALPLGPFSLGLALALFGTGVGGSLHRGIPDAAGGTLVISTR